MEQTDKRKVLLFNIIAESCKVDKTFSKHETLRTHFVKRHPKDSVQKFSFENNEDIGLTNTTNIQNIAQETFVKQFPCNNGNLKIEEKEYNKEKSYRFNDKTIFLN